jgi:hypothetical protein
VLLAALRLVCTKVAAIASRLHNECNSKQNNACAVPPLPPPVLAAASGMVDFSVESEVLFGIWIKLWIRYLNHFEEVLPGHLHRSIRLYILLKLYREI